MRIVTADQMKELDRRASEEFGVPSIVLMENAGLRTFDVVYKLLDRVQGSTVAVICGRGNNGGDGLVVARHLHQIGVDVRALIVGKTGDMKGDAGVNLEIALKSGIAVEEVTEIAQVRRALAHSDLVVDALFGTGIRGEITGLAGEVIDAINESIRPVVAVDLPSGLDADTGQIAGRCVWADETVTFALPKIGLATYPGAAYAGQVSVAEIGIPERAFQTAGIGTFLTSAEDVAARLPARPPDAHKGTFGHAALIAGSVGMTGAAAMAAASAVRVGAGLVTLGVPESLNDILEVKVTEAMTVPLPETDERSFSPAALERALELIDRCDAVAVGPGLSRNPGTVAFVLELLPQIEKPMVLDADGLNAVSQDVSVLERLKAPAVITPHPGEMARLTGTQAAAIQSNRLKAARDTAARFGVVVALKGAGTVTASPDGEAWINPTGSPAMASGGMGDILTGAIAGLLAQGLSVTDTAICGVYIHGRAGEIAAEEVGEAGAAATDLLPLLPRTIEELRKESK
ncbi:MAG: NAD(P)H-hydrate dehydratase [Armatimonadetes bacterium]|nr:NAD(P)H-hydrate dehydratase [Armatimonadota bacterium]